MSSTSSSTSSSSSGSSSASISNLATDTKTIMVLGPSGIGKSSLLSFIAEVCGVRNVSFKISNKATSCTKRLKDGLIPYKHMTIQIFDTPGLDDTDGVEVDSSHMTMIVDGLSRCVNLVA